MNRWVALGLAIGVLLAPAESRAIRAPPTCDYPTPSFGVKVDGPAAATALSDVYRDGAVALPIFLGLGMSTVSDPRALVEQGVISLDVVRPDGSGLDGHVEIERASNHVGPIEGDPAWAIWVGDAPFEPGESYELQYSFANSVISACPAATPVVGNTFFTVGTRSALDALAAPAFAIANVQPAYVQESGCCEMPESEACLNEGLCHACYNAVLRDATGGAQVSTPVPLDYFSLESSLTADGIEQEVLFQDALNSTFLIANLADEYCFHATLRPRAGSDPGQTIEQCVAPSPFGGTPLAPGVTEVPAALCADGPWSGGNDHRARLVAAFGATETEAVLALTAPPVQTGTTQPMLSSAVSDGGGCSIAPYRASLPVSLAGLALVLLGLRRASLTRKRRN